MKKLIFIFIICLVSCKYPDVVPKSDYIRVKDSLSLIIEQNKENSLKVIKLTDSINSGILMTTSQHDKIINYDRLYKFYLICEHNESQWIFYRGWSTRVFKGEK